MSSRIEREYILKIRDLLRAVPDIKNNTDIKSLQEFRQEMLFIRDKIGWALYWLIEGEFETIDDIMLEATDYLKSREVLWNEEVE